MMQRRRCCKSSRQRHLPEDLIFEIISRLSAKSLCRFRCVSRRWRSMIQSPVFVSAHRARSSANPKLLVCVDDGGYYDRYKVLSTAYPMEIKGEDTRGCWCYHGRTTDNVLASEAGLICSHDFTRNRIHVANPSTRECISSRILPHPIGSDRHVSAVCFGYDPVENKHKVVVLWSNVRSLEPIPTVADIFTVGSSEAWRRITNPSGLPRIFFYSIKWLMGTVSSICINGTIYLIGLDLEDFDTCWLVSFDVRMETFRAIPIPEQAGSGMFFCLMGLEGGGAATFIEYPTRLLDIRKFRLWILDDFGRQQWSCRDFILPASSFPYPIQLAGFTTHGEVILSQEFPPEGSTTLTLYFFQLGNSIIKTIELPGYKRNARLRRCDLTAFYHVENMQPLQDLVPNTTTGPGTQVLYFNNEADFLISSTSALRWC